MENDTNEIITFDDLKKCVDWVFKTEKTEEYREGYLDALYDMAATLGNDEELADYHELVEKN